MLYSTKKVKNYSSFTSTTGNITRLFNVAYTATIITSKVRTYTAVFQV